jgi:Fic family protein
LGLPGDAPIDTALICELHKRLMTGVRGANKMPGCIRTERNWIGGGSVEQAEFVPPPANLVPELMTSFHHYLTADTPLPQLIRIGLLHYEFETIHPFMDGNGRVGRLLISLLLAKWGLLPLPLLHLSSYLERNKREYCDRMLAIRGRGLWEDWLLFFLKGVIEQAARSADKVGRLHDLQRSWQNRLEDQNAPGSQIKLANKLFEMPILSVPMAAALLKLTYPGAKKVVDELVKMGILSEFLSPHFGFPSPLNLFIARDITTIANRQ